MDDLIDRAAAIDAIARSNLLTAGAMLDCKRKIEKLPSAQPERKTGEWSVEFSPAHMGGAYCECSQCNYKFAMGAYFEPDEWKFCPNCGADMRGEQDG